MLTSGYVKGDVLIEGPSSASGFNATFEVDSFGSILKGFVWGHGRGFSQGSEILVGPYFSGSSFSQVSIFRITLFGLEYNDTFGLQTNSITAISVLDGGSGYVAGDLKIDQDSSSGFFASFSVFAQNGSVRFFSPDLYSSADEYDEFRAGYCIIC